MNDFTQVKIPGKPRSEAETIALLSGKITRLLVEKDAYYAEHIDLVKRAHKLELALRIVLGSPLMELDGHDWQDCTQPSCVLAREALGIVKQKGELK